MSNDRMLYKHPGPHQIHGNVFDYVIVDEDDAEVFSEALADGWQLTTDDALAAAKGEAPKPVAKPKKAATPHAW